MSQKCLSTYQRVPLCDTDQISDLKLHIKTQGTASSTGPLTTLKRALAGFVSLHHKNQLGLKAACMHVLYQVVTLMFKSISRYSSPYKRTTTSTTSDILLVDKSSHYRIPRRSPHNQGLREGNGVNRVSDGVQIHSL